MSKCIDCGKELNLTDNDAATVMEIHSICKKCQFNEMINLKFDIPDEDKPLLLFVKDLRNPDWSDFRIGVLNYAKFYLKDGYDTSVEVVTHWKYLPKKPVIL